MYLCSSCLISLSYKERVIRCAGKGCSNNPEPSKGQLKPLFSFSSYEEVARELGGLRHLRTIVFRFLQEVEGCSIRRLATVSRRELEERLLAAIVLPEIFSAPVPALLDKLETTCLECLAANQLGWRTILCRSCGEADYLTDVKNSFEKALLEFRESRPKREKMAIIFTHAFLSLVTDYDPWGKEVIVDGDSLAGIGLFGERTSTF
jgi:hypothetical protein